MPETDLEQNKAVVVRFNKEVIERGSREALDDIMGAGFVNHSAPPGADNGPEGMWHTFNYILRPAMPDMTVEIEDQVAEGDKVTTRKKISGTHTGELMGIAPTNRTVTINVIDIVRLQGGKYAEHWGVNTLPSVLASLRSS